MQQNQPQIIGNPPKLQNEICQSLIVSEFYFENKLEDEANAVFISVKNFWHKFYFDCGILFWKSKNE